MKKSPTLHRPGDSVRDSRQEGGLPGALRAILAVPLFWKIVLANGTLMALVGAITALAMSGPGHESVPRSVLVVLLLGTLLAAAVLNAWIVALALRPLDRVVETAEAVRLGNLAARTQTSPLTDPELDRLGRVLNEMLEALSQARERQKELSHQVLRAEERERERIAGELYAGTAQTLAGVLVRLRLLMRQTTDDTGRRQMDEVASEIRAALEEVRAFARRLRPPELDELGVRAALEAHARGLAGEGGPRIDFQGELQDAELSDDARLALFRVVQEALTNAVRHSGASRISVTFQPGDDGLETVVEDDGTGFDPDELEKEKPARLGLLTMIERAGYAQGITQVESAPGSGTRIRLVLPWSPGNADGDPDPLAELLPELARAVGVPPGSR